MQQVPQGEWPWLARLPPPCFELSEIKMTMLSCRTVAGSHRAVRVSISEATDWHSQKQRLAQSEAWLIDIMS